MTIKDIKMLAKHNEAMAKKRAGECAEMALEEDYKSGMQAFQLQGEYFKGVADAWGAIVELLKEED